MDGGGDACGKRPRRCSGAYALLLMRGAARAACAAALSCATGVVLRGGLRVTVGRVHHASYTKRQSQSQNFYAFHVSLLILEKVVGFASEQFADACVYTSTCF